MSKLFEKFGVRVEAGEYVFREGDPADCCYMIHEGKIEISKITAGAKERIKVLGESEFFGEMAIINALPRMADAQALVDCELIQMDNRSFIDTIKQNHHFAINVFRLLTDRLRDTTEDMTTVVEKESWQAVLIEILSFALGRGKKDQNGKWILIPLDEFQGGFIIKFGWKENKFKQIINNLTLQKKINLKKDNNGNTWIAYDSEIKL